MISCSGHFIKSEQRVPDDDLYGDDHSPDSTETKKVKADPKAESAEDVPGVWFGLDWWILPVLSTMQYLVRVAWVIPSFEIDLLLMLVEPFFYFYIQNRKQLLWSSDLGEYEYCKRRRSPCVQVLPGGGERSASRGSVASEPANCFEYTSSSKLKHDCLLLASSPSWLNSKSLSRGRACPWHPVQPNQALLVTYLPWSHYIEQLSICVFWLHSIEDPTVFVKSKVILAKVWHTWRISSSVIQFPTSVLLAKTRRLAPMSRFFFVLLWAYTWPWLKNKCYRVDCLITG